MKVKIYGKNTVFSQFQNQIAAQVTCLPELLAIARQLAMQLSHCKSLGQAGKAGRSYCLLLCLLVLGSQG